MGLAASQARFLGLTARKSNNEYQAQQINQQRLSLADQQTKTTLDYQEKMTNRKFYFTGVNPEDGTVKKQLKYEDIVNPLTLTDEQIALGMTQGMGNRIVDVNGNIVVPNYPGSNEEPIKSILNKYNITDDVNDKTKFYDNLVSGKWVLQAEVNRTGEEGEERWYSIPFDEADFIIKQRAENPDDDTDTEFWRLYNTLVPQIDGKYQELTFENLTTLEQLKIRISDENEKVVVPELPEADRAIVYGQYNVDPYCIDPMYLDEKLRNGEWFIQQPSTSSETGWTDNLSWSSIGYILDDYDTTDDKAAEAEYNYLIAKIQKQDKMLELRLKQLETEHKALETELDSISKVIQTNIDNSFKTFA